MKRSDKINILLLWTDTALLEGVNQVLEEVEDFNTWYAQAHSLRGRAEELSPDVVIVHPALVSEKTWPIFTEPRKSHHCSNKPSLLWLVDQVTSESVYESVCCGATGMCALDDHRDCLPKHSRLLSASQYAFPTAAEQYLNFDEEGITFRLPVANPPLENNFQRQLTQRQLEVLFLVAMGYTTSQIARRLSVSETTILGHIKAIKEKTGASKPVEMVAFAFRLGLLRTDEG